MTNFCSCYIQIHFLCNKLSNVDLFPRVQLMIIDIGSGNLVLQINSMVTEKI